MAILTAEKDALLVLFGRRRQFRHLLRRGAAQLMLLIMLLSKPIGQSEVSYGATLDEMPAWSPTRPQAASSTCAKMAGPATQQCWSGTSLAPAAIIGMTKSDHASGGHPRDRQADRLPDRPGA